LMQNVCRLLRIVFRIFYVRRCLWGVYTIQQTSSISTCILNTFAGSLLDVCWIV